MELLEALNVKHSVKGRLLFETKELRVHRGDRIGLVGRNGCGKTTLLNILAKKVTPEEGTVIQRASCTLLPQLKRTDTTKSGGEVTQEYIQRALNEAPELLLADEPTTNLDLEHIEWLEKKLRAWQGALILVSHDRAFLDALCMSIWEIDEEKIKRYTGNYSAYITQKEMKRAEQQRAYETYEKKKRQLDEALRQKERKAQRATKKPKKLSASEAGIMGAKPYFAKKQKKLHQTANAMKTRLDQMEKVEKVKNIQPLKMDLPNAESFKNRIILRVENLSAQFSRRVLWHKANFMVRGGDKLAIIGSNGSGKTTLVKKIINQAEGITRSPAMKPGYFNQNLTIVDKNKTILENVRATSRQDESLIRTVLARMHFFGDDVNKPVAVLSGGERIKVALTKVFLSDMNTLILDEPTNYLDMEAVAALESLLREYEGSVLFVSHDRRFIEHVATRILSIHDQTLHVFEGTYQELKSENLKKARDLEQDKRMVVETKITAVLSRLSLEPTPELEEEFQKLVEEKKRLDK
ncbi:Vga family ABC-F type ribosomal protection protein [Sporolactobacillus sp. CPB3-1]|uniref:Vga family ABC-F type ribosomal protection protein n=1 Tax=Sporolactobacillus mangiferae TaxID=2940498 RepID=A0ABT0M9T0_9BACL|nr:Vga family ABC-F type ribosomal protection protein [Sporolactobacillus mangiferae]MCL1631625.1 Vga family ABC-F type ribosomal protection protein [Sporolactobacillus mangiferae]